MSVRRLTSWLTAPLMCLLLLCCVGVGAREQVPYSEAEFQISPDPTRAVLHITTTGMDMTVRSATLYGDGRLEITDNRAGEFVRQLAFPEVEELISGAVSRGLVEWDAMTIHAKQLTLNEGKPIPPRADAPRVLIILGVDHYKRGEYELERVERKISMSDPHYLARHFSEIEQYQGIRDLFVWMANQVELAKNEGNEP